MNCTNCNAETSNAKFCSRSCSNSYTNKAVPKRKRTTLCKIEGCECLTKSYRHNLCEAHWQEHLLTRMDHQTLAEVTYKHLHLSSAFALVRDRARKKFPKCPCQKCGYDKHTEVCHIKPIASFPETALVIEVNDPSNLIRLCPNCHWELDNLK